MKYRNLGILLLVGLLSMSKPAYAQGQVVPEESEVWVCGALVDHPTNTEIFPYWDHNGNYQTDDNDNRITAKGEVRYGSPEQIVVWDTDTTTCITLPYGVTFTLIVTESPNFNCLTPVTQTMVNSGNVIYELPCQRISPIEWLYHLWLGLVSN